MVKNARTERLFEYRPVGGLTRATAASALTVRAERRGAHFERRAIEHILDQTNDELDRRLFRDRYDKATKAERIYMAAMADLGDGLASRQTSRATWA